MSRWCVILLQFFFATFFFFFKGTIHLSIESNVKKVVDAAEEAAYQQFAAEFKNTPIGI
jgi:hypothetical protein